MKNQHGLAPLILILLAAAGIIIYLLLSSSASFKNGLFNFLYPKPSSHASEQAESVPDEILVKFKAGVNDQAKEKVRNEHVLQKIDEISQIGVERLKVKADVKDKVIEALSHHPQVKYAEPNYLNKAALIPNDPYYIANNNNLQWNLPIIKAPQAWDISTGSSAVTIAILDSGVDFNHEDLVGKGTGALDDYGHGTEVAGIAAASTNNSKGIASVCWLCPILSIKVLDSTGSGSDWDLDNGIVQATDQGVKVVNMSLGAYSPGNTSSCSTPCTLQDAINYAWSKGVLLVAASGNDNTSNPFYPAALNNVVAVGGTNSTDTRWISNSNTGSNYGSWVDVVAPGDGIYVPTMGGGYFPVGGTSVASPHVAALAGLIFSANPNLTNQQVVDIVISTTDKVGGVTYDSNGFNEQYGYGRINAYKALQKAIGIIPLPTSSPTPAPSPSPTFTPTPQPTLSDTTPPTVSITSPLNGATVKANSKVNISATATDNGGISKVEFYVSGSLKCSDTISPYSCSWSVPGKKNTSYTITVKAYDATNNSTPASITVKAQ